MQARPASRLKVGDISAVFYEQVLNMRAGLFHADQSTNMLRRRMPIISCKFTSGGFDASLKNTRGGAFGAVRLRGRARCRLSGEGAASGLGLDWSLSRNTCR